MLFKPIFVPGLKPIGKRLLVCSTTGSNTSALNGTTILNRASCTLVGICIMLSRLDFVSF